jgi:formiminotetrahydrofolate cyclodeaminase
MYRIIATAMVNKIQMLPSNGICPPGGVVPALVAALGAGGAC